MIFGKNNCEKTDKEFNKRLDKMTGKKIFAFFPERLQDGRNAWLCFIYKYETYSNRRPTGFNFKEEILSLNYWEDLAIYVISPKKDYIPYNPKLTDENHKKLLEYHNKKWFK